MHIKTKERLRFIKDLLQAKPQSRSSLLSELHAKGYKGVSERNLLEDIKKLRTGALNNIALSIDYSHGHYRLIDEPLKHFSEIDLDDQAGLIMAREYLSSLEKIPQVNALLDYLSKLGVPETEASFFTLRSRRPAIETSNKSRLFKIIRAVYESISKGCAIEFLYTSVWEEKTLSNANTCTIYPLLIAEWKERFYLFGLPIDQASNPTPENVRVFALDAISSRIEDLPRLLFNWSKLHEKLNMTNFFDHCIGIWRKPNGTPVKRKWLFRDWAASHVQACPLHRSQKVSELKGRPNEVLVELEVYQTPELDAEMAQYREFVIAIEHTG